MVRDGFGGLLKRWRTTRRLSQEQLALDAEISTRHLSFLETGKSRPSREMVLLLASALELELRERNVMLTSAGFAAVYTSSALESLEMAPVRRAIDLLLERQEPYGAIVFDRAWNVVRMNGGAQRLV
jgi:transcriptional regulator with XRE-family HTH domain